MKKYLLLVFVFAFSMAKAQKIDSIYVNLYTDSLKKGTHNYINIDGLLSNGNFLPLDSTHVIFTSDYGYFAGNSLVLPLETQPAKVHIKVALRKNAAITKEFDLYIKTMEDPEITLTNADMLKTKSVKTKTKTKNKNKEASD